MLPAKKIDFVMTKKSVSSEKLSKSWCESHISAWSIREWSPAESVAFHKNLGWCSW